MNKIYGIIAIFAFAGLLIPTYAIQVEAASGLDSVSYTHLTLPTTPYV